MNHHRRKLLHNLFAHPINANITMHDVESALQGLGAEVSENKNGKMHILLNRHSANIPTARHSLPKEDVIHVRKFIEQCGVDPERDYPL